MAPPPFRCDVFPERDRVRVVPVGELDVVTTPRLERAIHELLDAGFDCVVLDLSRLEFLDSTGLHLILSLRASADAGDFRLRVRP